MGTMQLPVPNAPTGPAGFVLDGCFWAAAETLGATDDEVGALCRGSLSSDRRQEINIRARLAMNELLAAECACSQFWLRFQRPGQ